MAKRKDPAVLVVRYFETAEINQAMLVLSLAKDAVKRRQPAKATTVRQARGARKNSPTTQPVQAPPPPAPRPLAGA